MQKIQITDHELFIYQIYINKKGLRRVKKNTLRKTKNLTMYVSSIPLSDYPKCFEKSSINSCVKAKMFKNKNSMIYTTILYPDIVKLMEEFRNCNFERLPDLIEFNQENPEVVSKILDNIKFKEVYHDTYSDYYDLLDKLKTYGDSSVNAMIDGVSEKIIPEEMNSLIKKIGSRK